MGALIVLLILVPILLIILLLSIHGKVSRTEDALYHVQKELDLLKRGLRHTGDITNASEEKKESIPAPLPPLVIPASPQVEKEEPPVITRKKEPMPAPAPVEEPDERTYREKEKWLQKNTDLEKFIGENLANKIGIAVLVLGISFFVKYAIDKNWINETGRVIIGLASGGMLVGLAHYIRNNYRSFSSVLIGGGLTVFYFTIAYAFHEYHLIGQQTAFIIMVVITALAVLLSLYYNRQELAILATIGGFITPFLVTTGQENYIALFTYLCILNTGLMALSWFKRWPAINTIGLLFTTIIYGGWLINHTLFKDELPHRKAFLFASLFYLLFVAMNIVNRLRTHKKFSAFDFIIVLSINFLYYIAGMVVLDYFGSVNYKGLFTVLLGVLNLVLTGLFRKKQSIDRNFVSLLLGLSLLFISLSVPVQFKGSNVTLFWAAEAVLLLWLHQRSRIIHLQVASVIISLVMLVSLLFTWSRDYFAETRLLPVIINRGCVTSLCAAAALFIYYHLLKKEKEEVAFKDITARDLRHLVLGVAFLVAYLAGVLEIFYQFSSRFPGKQVHFVYLQAYSFAFTIALLWLFRNWPVYPLLRFILTALCLGLYIAAIGVNAAISTTLLASGQGKFFAAHWIAAILLLGLLASLVRFFFRKQHSAWAGYKDVFTWIAASSIVLVLSVELYQVIIWDAYYDLQDWTWWQNLYYKAGLTILWSICSFVMMWLGMRYSFRTLRIISLTLFSVTLIKLFLYDIGNIPPGGKIAAFILLGILLLTVSFMYQRLKKIIVDDSKRVDNNS